MLTLIVGPPGTGKTYIYRNKVNRLIPNTDGNPSIYVGNSNYIDVNDEQIKYQMMNARHLGIRYIVECQSLTQIPLEVIKCADYCICTSEGDTYKYVVLTGLTADEELVKFTFNNGSRYPFVLFDRMNNSVFSHSD